MPVAKHLIQEVDGVISAILTKVVEEPLKQTQEILGKEKLDEGELDTLASAMKALMSWRELVSHHESLSKKYEPDDLL